MVEITTKTVKLSEIKLNPDNPRLISKPDMERLIKSLQEFPEMLNVREIVVDETMTALGGNMRTLALRKAGAKTCTVKIVSGWTAEEKRRFVISDNGAFGEWDMDLLSAWDDLPLIDWGIKIPKAWTEPPAENKETDGTMRSNMNNGKGEGVATEGGDMAEHFPVTMVLNQSEWGLWMAVKNRLKLKDDKAAFLKMMGGNVNA